MPFKPDEIAKITVDGMDYTDWESVQVHVAEGPGQDPVNSFRFTCSEGMPLAKDWAAIRIRPGMRCSVTLGGALAISGYVTTRQVAYTATQHGIEISGKSFTNALNGAAQTQTNEFKNKPLPQIAKTLVNPYGLDFKQYGSASQKAFERLNIAPGSSVLDTIEMMARSRGVALGTDTDGNLYGRSQDGIGSSGENLVEGVNILEGREVLNIDDPSGINYGQTQQSGTDQKWGAKVAHVPFAQNMGPLMGMLGGGVHGPSIISNEMPGDKADAQTRANFESVTREAEQVQVQITVYGWKKSGGGLWRPGETAHVKSPMLIMDEDLLIVSVTFMQDNNSGTRTVIELKKHTGGTGKIDYSQQNQTQEQQPATQPPAAPAAPAFEE